MGEPEPDPPPDEFSAYGDLIGLGLGNYGTSLGTLSAKENWQVVRIYEHGDEPEWQPLPFSSNLEYAMKAVDKYLADAEAHRPFLNIHYNPWGNVPPKEIWNVTLFLGDEDDDFRPDGEGATLPEAICRLLLDLKEKS